jgi:hypothetical protein
MPRYLCTNYVIYVYRVFTHCYFDSARNWNESSSVMTQTENLTLLVLTNIPNDLGLLPTSVRAPIITTGQSLVVWWQEYGAEEYRDGE